MIALYPAIGIACVFASWIAGLLLNARIRRTAFYQRHFTRLNFLPSRRLNRLIGLPAFQWLLRHSFLGRFNPALALAGRPDAAALGTLREEMTDAEIGHLIGFVLLAVAALPAHLALGPPPAAGLLLLNIPANLYPALLQQHNKRRIDRLLRRRHAATA